MKKKYISIALVLSLLSSLYGCGKGNDTGVAVESIAENSEAVNTEASSVTENTDNLGITITTIHYSSKVDDVERANGKSVDITFSDGYTQKYPKLVEKVGHLCELWQNSVHDSVGEYASYYDESFGDTETYTSEVSVDLKRLDDRLCTIQANFYDYSGGAHPNHGVNYYNIDPITGNDYTLNDVLSNPSDFPKVIRDRITAMDANLIAEIDDYQFDDQDVFEQKLSEQTYNFFIDEKGLTIFFSPYEVASYATGYIDVEFPYSDYPDLVQAAFKLDSAQDLSSIIKTLDGRTEDVEAMAYDNYETIDNDASLESTTFTVGNPSWDYYYNPDYNKDITASYIKLEKVKEDKTDWLDTDVWASQHGFEVASFPYTDGKYLYDAYDPVEYGYMYNSIAVKSVETGDFIIDYNLNLLCNGPDNNIGIDSSVTQYIRWAKVVDDTLYVAIGHNTYASSEPKSSYIVAIDLNTNEVIFRSQPLVSNAMNFQIVDDTIICGYGFTAEPDFIYLLDRYNGKMIEQIPVNSGPDQFEIVDDTLYVATYNTAYEYKIIK